MTVTTRKIPALRFPEFEGEWGERRLGQVFKVITRPLKMGEDVEYSLVTVKRRFEGIVQRELLPGRKIKVKSQFLVKTGDFLISKRQIVHCACEIVPKELNDSIVSNEYHVLAPKSDLSLQFFKWYVRMPRMRKSFFLSSYGVHIEKMLFRVDDWFKWKFTFPTPPEQQKIATFLTTIDTRIQQLSRKKALLEQYKKGVMQQIFSQEIRFKDEDGKEFPAWEDKRLKDVFVIQYGKDYKHLERGSVPVLGTGGVMTFVNDYLYDQPSVLIGRKGSIDKPRYIDVPFWTVDTCFYTVINSDFHPFFVYLMVSHVNWLRYNEATGVPSLNTKGIYGVKIKTPSFPEQQKIAAFLSTIDRQINLASQQLERMQTFKKGLLQQMFV